MKDFFRNLDTMVFGDSELCNEEKRILFIAATALVASILLMANSQPLLDGSAWAIAGKAILLVGGAISAGVCVGFFRQLIVHHRRHDHY